MKDVKRLLSIIEERANAALPGPWGSEFDQGNRTMAKPEIGSPYTSFLTADNGDTHVAISDYAMQEDYDNFVFIAHARTDVPRLIFALRKALEQRNHFAMLAKSQGLIEIDDAEIAEILEGK